MTKVMYIANSHEQNGNKIQLKNTIPSTVLSALLIKFIQCRQHGPLTPDNQVLILILKVGMNLTNICVIFTTCHLSQHRDRNIRKLTQLNLYAKISASVSYTRLSMFSF